ncbi:MAG TPA: hypothetical protein VHW65_04940 [Gemmatimonadales bacterium]|jgi:hypothetical protein|nr:hypothetical protein [Gemmatimonadales bacterium]
MFALLAFAALTQSPDTAGLREGFRAAVSAVLDSAAHDNGSVRDARLVVVDIQSFLSAASIGARDSGAWNAIAAGAGARATTPGDSRCTTLASPCVRIEALSLRRSSASSIELHLKVNSVLLGSQRTRVAATEYIVALTRRNSVFVVTKVSHGLTT